MVAASAVPIIDTSFESTNGTWQYIAACPSTSQAVVIDPVLSFNAATNDLSTKWAEEIPALVKEKGYCITHFLETHVHADHLIAPHYLQQQLGDTADKRPKACIELVKVFDHLCEDGEKFSISGLRAEALHLLGYAPDRVGYLISENVFSGDSIVNSDVGSTRCDFLEGSAAAPFNSMSKLLFLSRNYRIYTSRDYPPAPRAGKPLPYATVADQQERNKHVKNGTSDDEFVKRRSGRDAGLAEPKLINQALQFNVMGGHLAEVTADGRRYFVPRSPA